MNTLHTETGASENRSKGFHHYDPKAHLKLLIGLITAMAVIAAWCTLGVCGQTATPKKGASMPQIRMDSPSSQKDSDYLGIEARKPFSLGDIKASLIMIEIIGVYCPQCHKQRPHINRLFHRIQKDSDLSKKVKFIGIAAGATPMEVSFLVKEAKIPYPILTDEKFEIHKQLGEPRTPFNLVTTREGKVLWAHLGIIEDMNAFLSTLKSLAGQ